MRAGEAGTPVLPVVTLSNLDVIVVDCQATAASPRGCLIELGWGRTGPGGTTVDTRLVRLPPGAHLPPAVARVTGISTPMLAHGVDAADAWRAIACDTSALARQPAPAVAHFARFERPFLCSLGGDRLPLDLVCTHEIARRLLPDLPRCGLRALAGYLGRGVGALRRSGDHVEATAFVWRELTRLLQDEGVGSWDELHTWLARPARRRPPRVRCWPMPRDLRLSLPRAPGVYRMLRTNGDVLYVGKAASLRDRVNSYFRQRHGGDDRMLELLSQARGLSVEVTASVLEAALVEADEIKRLRPPYNVALSGDTREVWFASPDLLERAARPSARHSLGPFPSAMVLDQAAALVRGSHAAVGEGRWGPAAEVFAAGLAALRAAHPEAACSHLAPHERVLRLGARLWREGRRDRDEHRHGPGERLPQDTAWTPERVRSALERVALRTALAVRRARWLTKLTEASVAWSEPGIDGLRLIVIEHGECVARVSRPPGTTMPVPPGHGRTVAERHAGLTLARFDRVRVLLTEMKRLTSEGSLVAVRLGAGPPLSGARCSRVLAWL